MGVLKTIKTPGDGKHYPKRGDKLTVHYTGRFVCFCPHKEIGVKP